MADECMKTLSPFTAPQVLAVLAPDQMIPGTPAAQLGRVCRALVRRHLPTVCERLLAAMPGGEWVDPDDVTLSVDWDEAASEDRYDVMARQHGGHD